MSLFKFITSKTFLIQLAIAAVVFLILVFLTFQWLDGYTRHDQRIEVPNLSKLTLDVVQERLDKLDLRSEVIDSSKFNPDYPPYSVIDQAPDAGNFVKENRMIYLTLNPSGYPKMEIPDLIRHTRRQAEATLLSMGFQIGDVTYKPDIAEDAVLQLRHDGETILPGDRLMKTSEIDLVLGDGSLNYNSQTGGTPSDEEANPETEAATELEL